MAGYDEKAKQKSCRAIREIARSQMVSEAEVQAEMEIAIMAGYNNPDSAVQAEWAKAPFGNHVPTVEQFLTWGNKPNRADCLTPVRGQSLHF